MKKVFIVMVQRKEQTDTDEGYVHTLRLKKEQAEYDVENYNRNPVIKDTHAFINEQPLS